MINLNSFVIISVGQIVWAETLQIIKERGATVEINLVFLVPVVEAMSAVVTKKKGGPCLRGRSRAKTLCRA